MFLGAASAGLLADRFGRTRVFQVSMIFWGLGSILCGLSPTVQTLGAARILLGFGMGMEFPVAQSMVSEIIPAGQRGRYIALLEGFWPLGFIASGLLCFAVLSVADWRWVFILQGIPAIFVLIVRRYVPESPRWLASHGDAARAEQVMSEIEQKVSERLGGATLPTPAPVKVEPRTTTQGLATLFSPGYSRRTMMLWCLWFFALLGFYGLTTWLGALLQAKGFPVTKSVYYTILISLAGIPGFLTAAWMIEALGPQGDLDRDTAGSGDLLLLLRRRRRSNPTDHRRPLHAVLRVRHVVGALRLYAGALPDAYQGDRHRLCLGDRTDRLADWPFADRLHPAGSGTIGRLRARRRCIYARRAGRAGARRRDQRTHARKHLALRHAIVCARGGHMD